METSAILIDSFEDMRKSESYFADENGDEANDLKQENVFKGGWSSAIYIMVSEIAERFALFGISSNLVLYLSNELHESLVHAAETYYSYLGFSAVLPLLGAFIADSYIGRYKAIIYSSFIYILGLIWLTVSVGFVPTTYKRLSFFLSLYVVVLGQAGFRPCIQAFAADQFNEENEKERRAKDSFFNWWFFGIMGGASAAAIIVSYVQEAMNWWIGFCIIAISMILAFFVFLAGTKLYKRPVPGGSPWTSVFQVFVAAARKRHISSTNIIVGHVTIKDEPLGMNSLSHTDQFKFLDKATIIDEIDKSSEVKNPWRLCSVTQVEEVKMLIRVLPVWFSTLMFFVVIVQPASFFVKQSATLNRDIFSITLTPVSFVVSVGLFAIISVPLYDWFFVPLARRITNNPSGITVLQRIGTGLVVSIINMVVAALVEARRLRVAKEHGLADMPKAQVPMTVMWLLPQCILLGVSDIFGVVGTQQFFYDQIPDGMKSIGSAAFLTAMGMGSFLSHVIVSMVAKLYPHWLMDNLNASRLDNFYCLLAWMSLLWLGFFFLASRAYVYKKPAGASATIH
ncbi:hypothetical protein H6P81_001562 [Aristolochia fimbriata]|uniref:NPF family transporter n=1 Tax=Aristolochia fimbriata TaxID=158543 RepID=A0AAV7F8Q9_ARIFI|nr:hypothetical protein H6P81_001562 [Aristolochia fimbriata]